jgi:hypothetical protein
VAGELNNRGNLASDGQRRLRSCQLSVAFCGYEGTLHDRRAELWLIFDLASKWETIFSPSREQPLKHVQDQLKAITRATWLYQVGTKKAMNGAG